MASPTRTLRVALVAGPMYDHLYPVFDRLRADGIEVDVVVHADHPTLNRTVAELLGRGERLDLLATHSKYAPSQAQWLRPLDDTVDAAALGGLAPRAVELCRFGGVAYCLPRLIDVRVLWARTDRVAGGPDTWADLVAGDVRFGFPGRESGLFGTFFELVVAHGGRLFDDDHRPCLRSDEAVHAAETLVTLARRAPSDLPSWHYDQVDAALLDGRVDAAAAWPGGWGAIAASPLPLAPFPYPAGPARRVSYAGCHAWAIPTTCAEPEAATAALHLLLGHEAQALDASGGNMCAHVAALAAVEPVDDRDAARLAITRRTIDEAMITYPALARFPEVEDACWSALHHLLLGEGTPADAVDAMQFAAERALTGP
jgi:multiple sugar transport system substrate-binding protein